MYLHKNIYIWYLTTFFSFAAFTLPIWVIFNTNILGLSNTEAFILGVLPFGLSAFFEVPTGSWADKYGRAKIYQLGTLAYIFSVGSYIFFSNFYALALFQLIGGLGLAMQSGSLEALIHDSIKGNDKDIIYSKVHGRKMALLFVSRVVTVLLGGVMFAVNPRLPFVVAVITYVLGLIISLFFVEVRTETPSEISSYNHIKETLFLILNKKILLFFLTLVAIYSFLSEALFAIYQPYFQYLNIKIEQFGIFYTIISVFSMIGALSVTNMIRRYGAFKLLLTMMFTVSLTLLIMTWNIPRLTYIAIIPSAIAFGFVITLQNTVMQKLISSKHQATALSIASFARTFAFFASMVGIGVALDSLKVPTVNLILLSLTIIFIIPFLLGLKKKAII